MSGDLLWSETEIFRYMARIFFKLYGISLAVFSSVDNSFSLYKIFECNMDLNNATFF